MEILRQYELWEMSRTRQAELIREAQEAHRRNVVLAEQMPWWASLARRLQRNLPDQATPDALGNPADRISIN